MRPATFGRETQGSGSTQCAGASQRHRGLFSVGHQSYEVTPKPGNRWRSWRPPKSRSFDLKRTSARRGAYRGPVEIFHSGRRHQRGRLSSAPLISSISWLRGLDLNQRPLGYEGKSAPHTDQKDLTGTNNDGDLRGDEVVPCWFGSVRLLHRDFIGGSESPCRSCPVHCVQHVHPSWRTAHGVPPHSDLPRRAEAQG
jgi:hypothetical protein